MRCPTACKLRDGPSIPERGYPFTPDSTGLHRHSENVLQIDAGYLSTNDLVQRQGKLYEQANPLLQVLNDESTPVSWTWLADRV